MFSKPNSTALTVPKVNFYFLDLIQNKLHNSHHNDSINRVVHTIYNQSMIVFAYFHRHAVLTEVVSSQDKPSPVFLWKF